MARREFPIFIIFPDTYRSDSDDNWIFYEFLKLLQNQAKDHVL